MTAVRPQEAISYCIQHVPCYREAFKSALLASPCTPATPWTLQYHEDEITPGNVLKHDNRRKFHMIYCTFVELGIWHNSDGWLPLAVVRSTVARKARGAFSGILKTYLRHVFLGGDALSSIGVVVDLQPHPLVFLASFGRMICDGDSHRQAIACKGA